MAGKGTGAFISIGVNTEELQAGMDESARIVEGGAQKADKAFQGWSGNTNAVADATNQLTGKVKELAGAQKILIVETQTLATAAGGAESALGGLSVVGIAGMLAPLAAAAAGLALVKGLTHVFDDMAAAAKEAAEEIKRAEAAITALADKLEKVRNKNQTQLVAEQEHLATLTDVEAKRVAAVNAYYAALVSGDTEAAALALARSEGIEAQFPTLAKQISLQKEIVAELQKQADLKAAIAAMPMFGPGDDLGAARFAMATEALKKLKKAFEDARKEKEKFSPVLGPGNTEGEYQFGVEKKQEQVGADAAQKIAEFQAAAADRGNFPDLVKNLKSAHEHAFTLADAGDAIAQAFQGVGAAMGGTAGSIVAQIAAIAVLTLKFIGLAIAASAASAAETPIVGPWAAIAGGVAVAAALFGLIAGLADGGPMTAGRPYLVGERGPELVVPSASGTVIPNHQLGGRSVTINVTSPDAASFEKMLRRNDSALVRVLREASASGRA